MDAMILWATTAFLLLAVSVYVLLLKKNVRVAALATLASAFIPLLLLTGNCIVNSQSIACVHWKTYFPHYLAGFLIAVAPVLYLLTTAAFHIFRHAGKRYKHGLYHHRESVSFDRRRIILIDDEGKRRRIPWRQVSEIRVEKAAHKPTAESCDWVLVGKDESQKIRIGEDARGMNDLTARIKKLPGFDNSSLSMARRAKSENSFLIWMRK